MNSILIFLEDYAPFIGVLVAILTLVIWSYRSERRFERKVLNALEKWPAFTPEKTLLKFDALGMATGLSIDFVKEKLIVIGLDSGSGYSLSSDQVKKLLSKPNLHSDLPTGKSYLLDGCETIIVRGLGSACIMMEINASKLLGSEVIQDGKTVTTTSRGSQVIGAAAGGLVLGGVGAIIGGLSGKTESFDQLTGVHLRLLLENNEYPLHQINMHQGGYKTEPAVQLLAEANVWNSHLKSLMGNAAENSSNASTDSLSRELESLSRLYESGQLSEREFEKAKSKILD